MEPHLTRAACSCRDETKRVKQHSFCSRGAFTWNNRFSNFTLRSMLVCCRIVPGSLKFFRTYSPSIAPPQSISSTLSRSQSRIRFSSQVLSNRRYSPELTDYVLRSETARSFYHPPSIIHYALMLILCSLCVLFPNSIVLKDVRKFSFSVRYNPTPLFTYFKPQFEGCISQDHHLWFAS